MPSTTVYIMAGEAVKPLELSEQVFGVTPNMAVLHQVVTAQLVNRRQGNASTKTRAEVSGGNKKPYKQKGTGRARAGQANSPLWRGGGKIFPSSPDENFSQKVNRKMYRAAMQSMVSQLVREDRLVAVESLELSAPKTKLLISKLAEFGLTRALILVEAYEEKLFLAARNVPYVDVMPVASLDPLSLIKHDKVIATVGALKLLEQRLGGANE